MLSKKPDNPITSYYFRSRLLTFAPDSRSEDEYSAKVDIYALGMIFF